MTDLSTVPDPPSRLVEYDPRDWTDPGPDAGLPMYDVDAEAFTSRVHRTDPELYRREQWRRAREQWGAEHGLPWHETTQVLARAAARARARRAAAHAAELEAKATS